MKVFALLWAIVFTVILVLALGELLPDGKWFFLMAYGIAVVALTTQFCWHTFGNSGEPEHDGHDGGHVK